MHAVSPISAQQRLQHTSTHSAPTAAACWRCCYWRPDTCDIPSVLDAEQQRQAQLSYCNTPPATGTLAHRADCTQLRHHPCSLTTTHEPSLHPAVHRPSAGSGMLANPHPLTRTPGPRISAAAAMRTPARSAAPGPVPRIPLPPLALVKKLEARRRGHAREQGLSSYLQMHMSAHGARLLAGECCTLQRDAVVLS